MMFFFIIGTKVAVLMNSRMSGGLLEHVCRYRSVWSSQEVHFIVLKLLEPFVARGCEVWITSASQTSMKNNNNSTIVIEVLVSEGVRTRENYSSAYNFCQVFSY